MAANIVKRSGIATYTLTDILKFSEDTVLAKNKQNYDQQSVRGSCSEENIEQCMQYMRCHIRINCFVSKKGT